MRTTSENVTDEQIEALRREAAEAGDEDMLGFCDEALIGHRNARAECARVIAEAELRRA